MSFRPTWVPLLSVVALSCGCKTKPQANAAATTGATVAPGAAVTAAAITATPLDSGQEEYVQDIMAFTNTSHDAERTRMQQGSTPLKQEWESWEKQGPMPPARMTEFYKQTTNYMYELGEWHLFVPGKRDSDTALVEQMRELKPKNILDFGGGVGLMALPLARAGFDVTLADLDGTSLNFAIARAQRHDIKLKIWKSDVEAMPPDQTYDVILALDVLEHLPPEILKTTVDKLVKLKTSNTRVILSAPFGRTAVHPMHLDADEQTQAQVQRLTTELP